jgi:hypothetical protein
LAFFLSHIFTAFSFFLPDATGVPMKTADFAKGHGGHYNKQTDNTDFK